MEEVFESAKLSKTGRPVLEDGEVELISVRELRIVLGSRNGSEGEPFRPAGAGTISSHRIIWRKGLVEGPAADFPCALHLARLSRACPRAGGYFKRSSKIDLYIGGNQGVGYVLDLSDPGVRDDVLSKLQSAMKQRLWEDATVGDVVNRRMEQKKTTVGPGVAGILERQRAHQEATKDIAAEAFSDLNSLMTQAKDLVVVINRYATALKRKRTEAACSQQEEQCNDSRIQDKVGGGEDSTKSDKLETILLSMGMLNPVTRASAGTKTEYHAFLAEQLADFLIERGLLTRFGGTITLTDAYAIFNRARGTELISPQDLLSVCSLLEPMGLGLILRRFSSGVLALQSSKFSDDEISAKLLEIAQASDGVLATEASRLLHLPLILAEEHIHRTEALEILCRDETIEGIRFWPNKFFG